MRKIHAASDVNVQTQEPWWVGVDWFFLLLILALLIEGLIAVYSTSVAFAVTRTDKPETYFIKRQLFFAVVGLVGMLTTWRIGYEPLKRHPRLVVGLAAGVLGALLLLLIRNRLSGGPGRTLLGASLQPAEFAKVVLILYLSVWLNTRRRQIRDWRWELAYVGAITGVFALLVLLQPDLSAALTVFTLGFMMLLLAGAHPKQLMFTLAVGLVVIGVGLPALRWLYPVGIQRITDFWISLIDPLRVGGHMREAMWAFLRGGWFGVGIGMGKSKFYYLPLPHTDSVFAVIGEEWGLVGASVVLLTYALFLWRGLQIASRSPDPIGQLLASGLVLWITGEAVLNMAGIVGLLPQAGNVMPFFSYGGSNLTAVLTSLGLVLRVAQEARLREARYRGEGRAILDLRGRNRRRRVSRARGAAATGRH
ncbi:MAG: FtsW/RodA/SpoVE family cell cycle protein [Chloroflexi bacterium]|nr:FtsW/RodA/SpoVE family cell cycle protein [Chloroflexota bacterium]